MKKFAIVLGAMAMALPSLATPAHAVVALTVSDVNGQQLGNPPFTLGWTFTANSNISVTGLGFFDDAQDGLAERHDVGLWDSVGNLLASTTIGAGTSGSLINQFRYNTVSSAALMAGNNYFIGALYTSGADNVLFSANNVATDPAITYLNGTFAAGGTLTNPTGNFGGGNNFFGPNFTFNAGAVPEPATWLMMIMGFGLVGAAMRRQQKAVRVSYG